ncbi:hypothetical protein ACKE5C_19060 (plasmid) [Aneurinibacillus thermoaerophilus]|uniref:Tail fiber protein n=3 Tax=Aneurinibacillus thermoaerophilus TaxID=143495 RepID=A0ABX8YG47_ANETH|nr:hypothetical protein [Aneurinibacillus thermoaerophilus]QYY44793.1 hypothetical protein K3F53_18840 [Aneurinibacillus thermoaerophilus]
MTYKKQSWLDEIPDLTKPILDPKTGKQKTDPQTGRPLYELVQEGTRITADRLNHMEDGITEAHLLVENLAKEWGGNFVASPNGTAGLQFSHDGLTVSWTAGIAYVNGRRFEVPAGSMELNPTQGQYIYLDTDGTMKKTTSQATAEAGLLLWYFATDASQVITSTDKRKIITPDTYAKKEEVVMKEPGKGLSTNDYSDTEKGKVASHETRLQKIEEEMGEGTPFQTTLLPGLNIVTVPRDTPFNVLNLTGRTLVNLNGRKGREATSNTLTVDSAKRYLIINEGGTSVTVNGTSRPTPYKVTGVTSLNLSWASGEKVAVYDITGDTTIDSLTNAQINAKYPYVDDVKGVRNPYIIRYGKNLLPPFTEWSGQPYFVVNSPYSATLNRTGTGQNLFTDITAIPSTAYAISYSADSLGTVEVQLYKQDGTLLSGGVSPTTNRNITFNTTADTAKIRVIFNTDGGVNASVKFENPMLNIGDTPLPFEPQNNDYQFFDVTLHSNTDGSVRDELFFRDGKPYKLKRFEELVLDGSLNWSLLGSGTGYKTLITDTILPGHKMDTITSDHTGIKYDGKILINTGTSGVVDAITVYPNGHANYKKIAIQVGTSDSGWGESYTPTAAEIQAYFYGWKMHDGTGAPYNGTGTKTWTEIPKIHAGQTSGTTTLPTSKIGQTYASAWNPSDTFVWTPYSLLYQLAEEIEVPVSSEGEISLHEGDNLLEVGTGVVRREIANPKSDGGSIAIGIDSTKYAPFAGTETRYRIEKVFDVYKNDQADHTWAKNAYDVASYGKVASKNVPANFDSSAAYSITYIVENKHAYTAPLIDIQGEYRTKLAGVVAENSQDIADLATRLSVVETQYARKQQGQWIVPVLLNGYTNVYQSGYYKDDMGIVRLKGRLGIGITSNSTIIFYLPVGYRPSLPLFMRTPSGDIYIGTDGGVRIYNYASNPSAANVVLIDGISFRAEQ